MGTPHVGNLEGPVGTPQHRVAAKQNRCGAALCRIRHSFKDLPAVVLLRILTFVGLAGAGSLTLVGSVWRDVILCSKVAVHAWPPEYFGDVLQGPAYCSRQCTPFRTPHHVLNWYAKRAFSTELELAQAIPLVKEVRGQRNWIGAFGGLCRVAWFEECGALLDEQALAVWWVVPGMGCSYLMAKGGVPCLGRDRRVVHGGVMIHWLGTLGDETEEELMLNVQAVRAQLEEGKGERQGERKAFHQIPSQVYHFSVFGTERHLKDGKDVEHFVGGSDSGSDSAVTVCA